MIGSRVQQTCEAPCGANRRGREKRRGRNVSVRWYRPVERVEMVQTGSILGVDARGWYRWRGSSLESSREEFGGRHVWLARETHGENRAAFTSKRLRGRGKGQFRILGYDTLEGRVV